MTPRDKPAPTAPLAVAPLGQAVMESFAEGIVVFDTAGRLVYANEHAKRALGVEDDAALPRSEALRARLGVMGGRTTPLRAGGATLGEAVFLPRNDNARTLAERERQAIVDTLEATGGRLAEAARRLGISRTTLWRRLKAYGLRPTNGDGRPE
ncbi:MAG TPA: helix-turn-helix domain-containing protein [Gemmatimonadales bacterium]|nr:helix-turn-helix domain-containing protein [Gemmatimonadales bacterium]